MQNTIVKLIENKFRKHRFFLNFNHYYQRSYDGLKNVIMKFKDFFCTLKLYSLDYDIVSEILMSTNIKIHIITENYLTALNMLFELPSR